MITIEKKKIGVFFRVTLSLQAEPGKRVCVAGSFNDWDPESGVLSYSRKDGMYQIVLSLPAGYYEYKFVVDDNWLLDETNPNFAPNDFGTLNSVFSME